MLTGTAIVHSDAAPPPAPGRARAGPSWVPSELLVARTWTMPPMRLLGDAYVVARLITHPFQRESVT